MKYKGIPPEEGRGKETHPLISTYYAFFRLKQLYRQGWLQAGVPEAQCESVAEHSLGVILLTAILGLAVEKQDREFDLQKALLMALCHDLGEVFAGDFTPRDSMAAQEKHALERKSLQSVFGKLPEGSYFMTLWEEFETGNTVEAQFVRQLDRLEMGLQASVYHHLGLLEEPQDFLRSMAGSLHEREFVALGQQIIALSFPEKGKQGEENHGMV